MSSPYLNLKARPLADVTDTKHDKVFETRDGWYAVVAGRTFGCWRSRGEAIGGMHVERRRFEEKNNG